MGSVEERELSPIQKQFWLQNQSDPQGSAYNMASLFEVSGVFNQVRGDAVLSAMIQRHPILRTIYKSDSTGLRSELLPHSSVSFYKGEYKEETLLQDIKVPFNLEEGPLLRAYLYPRKNGCYLLFVFHHIVMDLRSKEIFGKEFSLLYNSGTVDFPSLPLSAPYEKYNHWLTQFRKTEKWESMKQFWLKETEDVKPLLLTYDRERPATVSTKGTRRVGAMSASVYSELNRYCLKKETDPFLVLLSAYFILLHKFSGQTRISVGVPRTNREGEQFKDTLGAFVNILPMVLDIDGEMKTSELLQHVRKKMLLIHRNQYIPYTEIISLRRGESDRKFNPLFQAGFTNEYPMELYLDGLTAEPLPIPGHGSQLDLFLYFWKRNGVYHWEIEYNSTIFNEKRIDLFIESFRALLREVLSEDNLAIKNLSLLTKETRSLILDRWNGTEQILNEGHCVHHYFEEQAFKHPERTALLFKGESLSFGELNRRANVLAEKLICTGIRAESIIGLSMERSFEMVIGMLGILKAGGAYLPMEPTHPDDYKTFLIEDARLEIILSVNKFAESLRSLKQDLEILTVDALPEKECPNPSVPISLDNRAYLFYTSGTTGKPKGVDVLHDGLADRILWMDRTFHFGGERKTLLKTPYNFDVSGMEFWLPLMTGAPLVIAESGGHLDNSYLAEVIEREGISIVHFVPSLLKTFLKSDKAKSCSVIKDVLCCGEALPATVVNEFYRVFPHAKLHNLYGPTEATIFITYWECEKDVFEVPIGKPVFNTQVFVVDEYMNLLPPGITGELYLAGSGLARGYLNREDLTRKAFVPQPWAPHKIMYKSGDLAQWTPEGEILCFGRNDNQVQLHGQRVELGEIENILNSHPSVEGSALMVTEEFGAEQKLVAYLVKKEEVTIRDLTIHIGKSLPKYMIPSYFYFLANFPLSSNGKLDRKKLPDPRTLIGTVETHVIKPETKMEEQVARIWEKLLGCPVGRDNTFFELGGSSLQLMELQQELSLLTGKTLPITALFEHSSLQLLAEYLSGSKENEERVKSIHSRAKKQKHMKMKRRRL
jgi:amino acid adenylation domain-containing protein